MSDPAARLAARQYGTVSHRQLVAAGVGADAIAHRLRTGRLHRLFHGVYLVGHPVLPPLAREAGALLACGPETAALTLLTAAGIWELSELPRVVDVLLVGRSQRHRHPGIRFHRTVELERDEIRTHAGLPVTSPARTLVDLGAVLAPAALARMVDEARAKRLITDDELLRVAERRPTARGPAVMRRLLAAEREPQLTRSEAERRLLILIERAGLPRPLVNTKVAGHEVDLYWPAEHLVVEVDGFAFHSRPADFERDRRRDQDLAAVGIRVARVTWRQIASEPEALVARLARALFPAG